MTREQVDLLRAGLRLEDPALRTACAVRLEPEHLDVFEAERVLDLLLPQALHEGTPVDWERLRWMMGFESVPRLFRLLADQPNVDRGVWLGKIHVIMRSEHGRLGAQHIASKHPRVQEMVGNALWCATGWDDRDRELIGEALLRAHGIAVPPEKDEAGGLDARLRSLLQWICSDAFHDVDLGGLDNTLPGWCFRWLGDSRPAPSDSEFLLHLLSRLDHPSWRRERTVVVRALGQLEDTESLAVLRDLALGNDPFALSALLRRGDAGAGQRLARSSGQSAVAFALLTQRNPEAGRRVLKQEIAKGVTSRRSLPPMLDQGLDYAMHRFRIRWKEGTASGLVADVIELAKEQPLDALLLGLEIPGCATRSLAEAAIHGLKDPAQGRILASHLDEEYVGLADELTDATAFLDCAAPDALRGQLQRWVAGQDRRLQELGGSLILKLRAPSSSPAFLAFLRKVLSGERQLVPDSALELTRREIRLRLFRADPSVLSELSPREAQALRGVDAGLPEYLAYAVADHIASTPDAEPTKQLLLAGDGVGAMLTLPDATLRESIGKSHVGFLKDERLIPLLERWRSRRNEGLHAWATGELSLLGDASARRETWHAIKSGSYYWGSQLGERVLTNDFDAATIPYWIEELRTQCCRISTNASALYPDVLDDSIEWFAPADGARMTSYEWACSRWLPRAGRRLVWSGIRQRFLVIYD